MSFEPDSIHVDRVEPAVNFGERRGVSTPDILMMHYTGMDDGDSAVKWLCCEESGVSCHYLVFEDGEIVQMVEEFRRAHHAGKGGWEGHDDVNSRSIGIEIVNGGHPAGLPNFPFVQMEAVARLALDIIERYSIQPYRVLAHSDTAPGRKEDPGEKFDWAWLSGRKVGHWTEPTPLQAGPFIQRGDEGQAVEAWQSMLAMYGYNLDIDGVFDERTQAVTEAFQRHFRQALVDGVADFSTIDTLHRLSASRPQSTVRQRV
ncbi:MAG: N-acetylmuramoyl-L-alanine amidase [Pseudomonadota bacterium]